MIETVEKDFQKVLEKYGKSNIDEFKIVTDLNKLRVPTEQIATIEEGEEIAAILFKVLNNVGGIGLTANQIGINKSVFVVTVNEPLYFINPRILSSSTQKIPYRESCLSIPKYSALVVRNQWVHIDADNLKLPMFIGNKEKNYSNITLEEFFTDIDLLQSVAVQHEFHHTEGILIKDIDIKSKPIKAQKKVGRNEAIAVKKTDDGEEYIKFIKFKHLEKYEKDGWVLS